jgi:hypothetical protein
VQDPKTASHMLARLGDLLRLVLRGDSQPETTLREEIGLTRAYVAMEKMRFGDRLSARFEIPLSGAYELELRDGVRLRTGRQYRDAIQNPVRGLARLGQRSKGVEN